MIVQHVNEMQWSKYMHGTLVRVHVHYVQKIFDINIPDFLRVQTVYFRQLLYLILDKTCGQILLRHSY